MNSSYHGCAHEEAARQDEAAGVHLCKDARRRVKTAERSVFCAKYTSVIPGARILLVGASVNGRPCLSGAKVPLRQRCCAPCRVVVGGWGCAAHWITAALQPLLPRRVRRGAMCVRASIASPAMMLRTPLGFKESCGGKKKNIFHVI